MQQQPVPALTLEGVVSKIIFFNDENAYLVMELETAGESVVVVGYAANLAAGESVRVTGDYITHPTYGRQFSAASIESIAPTDEAGILAYLESGAIKGIGKTQDGCQFSHRGSCRNLPVVGFWRQGVRRRQGKEIGYGRNGLLRVGPKSQKVRCLDQLIIV